MSEFPRENSLAGKPQHKELYCIICGAMIVYNKEIIYIIHSDYPFITIFRALVRKKIYSNTVPEAGFSLKNCSTYINGSFF